MQEKSVNILSQLITKIGVPPDWVVRLLVLFGSIKGNQNSYGRIFPLIFADSMSSCSLIGVSLVNSEGNFVG